MRQFGQVAWLAALLAAGSAFAEATLEVGIGLVDAHGYLQTPAGGAVGTATWRRPTLEEAGLGEGHYRHVASSLKLARSRLHLRYADVGAAGTATLTAPLVSQAGMFGAGEQIRSRAAFDALSLGWTWVFERDGYSAELGGQALWTAFDLRMDGASHAVDRRYRVYAIGAMGVLSKQLGQRTHAALEATIAPAFDGASSFYALAPSIRYRMGAHFTMRLGARFEAFGYDDAHKQALPNHLRVRRRLAPTLALGVRW